MLFLTPAWKGENKDKGIKSVGKIKGDDKLYQVVLEAPIPDVKRAAIDRISDDAVLLKIMQIPLSSYFSLGAKEYTLRNIKQYAFEHMKDEKVITEAALLKKPEKDGFLDKIRDEALLFRLAQAYYLPAAFKRISDDKKQIELAQARLEYVDLVRNKHGYDWELLLLDGDCPQNMSVEYAHSDILSFDTLGPVVSNSGIRLLQNYLRYNRKDLPPDVSGKLEKLNDCYGGIELWARIGMLGLFPPRKIPKDKIVEYAKQMILEDNRRGVTVLMRHFQEDFPPEKLEQLEKLRRTYAGRELWTQIGLLGFFPREKTTEYCLELINGGDWRGLDIMLNAVKEAPYTLEAASMMHAVKELYRRAAGERDADLMDKFKTLREGRYGRHADYQSTACGYTDHVDNGVAVHYDLATL